MCKNYFLQTKRAFLYLSMRVLPLVSPNQVEILSVAIQGLILLNLKLREREEDLEDCVWQVSRFLRHRQKCECGHDLKRNRNYVKGTCFSYIKS